jgi:UDP-N-acetylglucosamine transferase subunit ALG13
MIFVTIGSMFPFDRLIRAVDNLAPAFPGEDFFAQVGDGAYRPTNLKFERMLSAGDFRKTLASAKLVVAHAGMGSVISAMEAGKPIVIVPRRPGLGEVTTDHQLATARWLTGRPGVYAALDETEIGETLTRALSAPTVGDAMPSSAPEPFIEKLRGYLMSA